MNLRSTEAWHVSHFPLDSISTANGLIVSSIECALGNVTDLSFSALAHVFQSPKPKCALGSLEGPNCGWKAMLGRCALAELSSVRAISHLHAARKRPGGETAKIVFSEKRQNSHHHLFLDEFFVFFLNHNSTRLSVPSPLLYCTLV